MRVYSQSTIARARPTIAIIQVSRSYSLHLLKLFSNRRSSFFFTSKILTYSAFTYCSILSCDLAKLWVWAGAFVGSNCIRTGVKPIFIEDRLLSALSDPLSTRFCDFGLVISMSSTSTSMISVSSYYIFNSI